MIVLVDTNEATDREKNHKYRAQREDNSNLRALKRLQTRFGDVQTATLTCGDINVILDDGKLLAIERKRAGDFLGSIKGGHIQRQVQRMAENADWSVVIVEGQISFDKDDMAVIPHFDKKDVMDGLETTGWNGNAVRAMIYAIMFNGTPVVMIQHPQQLPDIIQGFIQFCSKPVEHMQGLGRRRIVSFPPITLSQEIVSAFPGVGFKLTKKLEEFAQGQSDNNTPTLADMLCWGSYLGKIAPKSRPEGWGNMKVTNFRAALGLPEGHYLTIEVDKEELEAKKKLAMKQKLNGRSNSNGKSKR